VRSGQHGQRAGGKVFHQGLRPSAGDGSGGADAGPAEGSRGTRYVLLCAFVAAVQWCNVVATLSRLLSMSQYTVVFKIATVYCNNCLLLSYRHTCCPVTQESAALTRTS
jgi:hypothetical protein